MNTNEQRKPKSGRFPRAVWIVLILLGIAAAASYLFLDTTVSGWFRERPGTRFDNVWVDGFKQLGKAGTPIWLLLVWSCLTNRWRPTLITIAAMILVGLSVCPLKAITRRCRPNMTAATSQQGSPQDREIPWHQKVSFPSGDTAVAFAAATTLSSSLGRLWPPALFLAAGAVGMLRITGQAHYPSDVLAGALVGVLCGLGAIRHVSSWLPLGQLRIEGRWRLVAALVLILVVPFLSPFLGMRSLLIFLKVYALPLTALALLWLGATRLQTTRPPDAVKEGADPQPQNVAFGNPQPESLKEPMS
jgi:membrane-associated phospholipid phosphatase